MRIVTMFFLIQAFAFAGLEIKLDTFPCYLEQKVKFLLENKLEKAFTIKKSRVDCSCIGIKFDKDKFALGEKISGELTLSKNGVFSHFTKKVFVEHENGILTINVSGNAKQDFILEPARNISFGRVKKGKATTKLLSIIPSDKRISLSSPKIELLKGGVSFALTKNKEFNYNLVCKGLRKGLFKVKVIFPVVGKERPPLVVQAYGIVR